MFYLYACLNYGCLKLIWFIDYTISTLVLYLSVLPVQVMTSPLYDQAPDWPIHRIHWRDDSENLIQHHVPHFREHLHLDNILLLYRRWHGKTRSDWRQLTDVKRWININFRSQSEMSLVWYDFKLEWRLKTKNWSSRNKKLICWHAEDRMIKIDTSHYNNIQFRSLLPWRKMKLPARYLYIYIKFIKTRTRSI